jgi:RNA polymerase sigma factor (sigma-70 family)
MRRGNEAAFEVVYRRYARRMLALCHHILGSRDEAEEALQYSFAAAWADLQRPDRPPPVLLRPWLYAVARHRCLSMLRSRRPITVELDEAHSTSALADEVGQRADLRALLADLHDLPEEQRTALVLSELAGLPHTDIADVLGRQTSGVKSLIFQARTTLGDWREAREAPCAEIREQLSVLRGGALRRRALRRHLQGCASCRAFRAELQAQRRRLAIVLPVLPSLGLKEGVLAAVGLGTASGAGAAAGGAVVWLGVPALVPLGSAAVATMAVVGVLAEGTPTPETKTRGRGQPTALARGPADDRVSHGDHLSPGFTQPDPEDRAERPPGRSPEKRRRVDRGPNGVGVSGPETGQTPSVADPNESPAQPLTREDQEAEEKPAKGKGAEKKTAEPERGGRQGDRRREPRSRARARHGEPRAERGDRQGERAGDEANRQGRGPEAAGARRGEGAPGAGREDRRCGGEARQAAPRETKTPPACR